MKFTAQFLEELRYRNPIEEVVSGYVTLKRRGNGLVGLCPFHSEKTPSFSVSPENNLFYCFGCGAGGDTVSFIMREEGLDYPSAVEFLAKRAGIPLPEDDKTEQSTVRRSRVLEMNTIAAKYFHAELLKSETALAYFEKRKIPMPLIRHFGLGFAPDSFGALTSLLRKEGYTDEEMRTAFLCGISQKTGKPYDYFRNRVMFPIIDVSGNVVAFGGRVMDDSLPKYLNSSDTPAFSKKRNLFALNFARRHCEDGLILCEGYMDVVSLHGAGFENAVASLGTAVTPEHARLIKRYTNKVIISLDADEAGQRAADKAFAILGEAGLETKILRVEGAKDPDEYIKKFGKDKFRALLAGSRSKFDFKLEGILARHDISLPDEKVKAAAEITGVLAGVYSAVERELYLRKAAEVLGVPTETLASDVKRAERKKENAQKKEQTMQVIRAAEGFGDRVNPERMQHPRAAKAEETALGILLRFPETKGALDSLSPPLSPDDFTTAMNRRVFEAFLRHAGDDAPFELSLLTEEFTPEEMSRIVKMTVDREGLSSSDNERVLAECAAVLREEKTKADASIEDILRAKRNRK